MIDVRVRVERSDGFREKLDMVARPDLMPLAVVVAEVVRAGDRRERLAGMGRLGVFPQLARGTIERRRRAGKGSGEPLVPDGEASRFAHMETEIKQIADNAVRIEGYWPGTEAFIEYHIRGTEFMPERDPVYISERTMAEVQQAVRDYFVALLARINA